MKDARWAAAHRVLASRLTSADRVLVPRGRWDPFPCAVRQYDSVIEIGDATALVLHKGRLTGLSKPQLAGIVRDWRCVYANDVLVVYARGLPRALADRLGLYFWHKRRVTDHLQARSLRRLPVTLFYLHIPKTGGTAVLFALRHLFRSSVYYTTEEAFLAHPPEIAEYDLVAVHGCASLVQPLMGDGDVLAGLVRDPARRVLSAAAHSRRDTEDTDTFAPGLSAMRAHDLSAFLVSQTGRVEARLQLILLGSSHQRPEESLDDDAMLARALKLTGSAQALFAPSSQSQALLDALLRPFGISAPRLRRRNVNAASAYSRHDAEFAQAKPLLASLQGAERLLVDAIRKRFAERQCGG